MNVSRYAEVNTDVAQQHVCVKNPMFILHQLAMLFIVTDRLILLKNSLKLKLIVYAVTGFLLTKSEILHALNLGVAVFLFHVVKLWLGFMIRVTGH